MLAPIVLFTYNRLWHTQQTVEALQKNELASESELFIFSDGPKDEEQNKTVTEVRNYIKTINGFKKITIYESFENKGLANSIIDGVTKVVNEFGKVIVLEDDIVASHGFLRYMNDALNVYEFNKKVMHVSGYMYPHKENLPDTFFFNVPLCWGWGTWARAWKYLSQDSKYLFDYFEKSNQWKKFDAFGGTYLKDQLVANLNGKLNTWFIKWHASVLIKDGLTLYPGQSLVNNIGFDGSGVHCGPDNSFKNNTVDNIKVQKRKIKASKAAKKIIVEFYYGKPKRNNLWSLKEIIKKLFSPLFKKCVLSVFPELYKISYLNRLDGFLFDEYKNHKNNCKISSKSRIYSPYSLGECSIGDYTYIARNSRIQYATIGNFCSIGPNFYCGYGIHPINGISTSPEFYSTRKQTGHTFSKEDKIKELKSIHIGNDVFIGMNVSVLDGVSIGDGAVIGAGAVVSKDIPPYAIAVGAPIQIKSYRFNEEIREKLLKIKWWNFSDNELQDVEKYFFEIDKFIEKYSEKL